MKNTLVQEGPEKCLPEKLFCFMDILRGVKDGSANFHIK